MMSEKRFGWNCPYKDNRDFCTALLKPKICCPSICFFFGLGEMNKQEDYVWYDCSTYQISELFF